MRQFRFKTKPYELLEYSIGEAVKIKTSDVNGAGDGVFALMDFKKGDYITYYDGFIIMEDEEEVATRRRIPTVTSIDQVYAMNLTDSKYDYNLPMGTIYGVNRYSKRLKSSMKHRGAGHLINDALCYQFTKVSNNCKFITDKIDGRTYVVATRDIENGEELYANYDYSYWQYSKSLPIPRKHLYQHITLQNFLSARNLYSYELTNCSHDNDAIIAEIQLYRLKKCRINKLCVTESYTIKLQTDVCFNNSYKIKCNTCSQIFVHGTKFRIFRQTLITDYFKTKTRKLM